jgi:hypothetical protein
LFDDEESIPLDILQYVDPKGYVEKKKRLKIEALEQLIKNANEELEDEDNTMNTELKALLEGTTEDADLEAKVGALGSNTDVLDLDIIPPQGVDGDDDEDVQYIPPETNQAPRTPEPDEEFSDKGELGFQEICDQHLYVPFSFKNCADILY